MNTLSKSFLDMLVGLSSMLGCGLTKEDVDYLLQLNPNGATLTAIKALIDLRCEGKPCRWKHDKESEVLTYKYLGELGYVVSISVSSYSYIKMSFARKVSRFRPEVTWEFTFGLKNNSGAVGYNNWEDDCTETTPIWFIMFFDQNFAEGKLYEHLCTAAEHDDDAIPIKESYEKELLGQKISMITKIATEAHEVYTRSLAVAALKGAQEELKTLGIV